LPEQPLRPQVEHGHDEGEDHGQLEVGRDIARDEIRQDAHGEAAYQRPGDGAEAAEHGPGEGEDGDVVHHRRGEADGRRDQGGRDAAESHPHRPGQPEHPPPGHAHQRRHLRVLGDRADGEPQPGPLVEQVQRERDGHRETGDEQVVAVHRDRADRDAGAGDDRGHCLGPVAPDHAGQPLHSKQQPDGHHDAHDRRGPLHPPHEAALGDGADSGATEDRQDPRGHGGQAEAGVNRPDEQGHHRGHRPVGEVDHVGCLENDVEPERGQGIDAAEPQR
jgi:hypothetical protein